MTKSTIQDNKEIIYYLYMNINIPIDDEYSLFI